MRELRSSSILGYVTVFFASMAAFMQQPLVGKMLLPVVGGSIAAWTTVLVAYQCALIAGYLVAARLLSGSSRRAWLVLLGVCSGPLLLVPISGDGVASLLGSIVLVLLGYTALATLPILLAHRESLLPGETRPYRLSAVSSAGSFAGLFTGLLVMETLDLSVARYVWWMVASASLFLGAWLVSGVSRREPVSTSVDTLEETTLGPTIVGTEPSKPLADFTIEDLAVLDKVLQAGRGEHSRWFENPVWGWLFFSGMASALLVAFTTWLNTSTVVLPVLWILPLSVFLALFSFVFAVAPSRRTWPSIIAAGTVLLAMVGLGNSDRLTLTSVLWMVPLYGASIWAVLRGLERRKPEPARLASFWVAVAVGGALGGAASSFLAPALFPDVWEWPMLLMVGLGFVPQLSKLSFTQRLPLYASLLVVPLTVEAVARGNMSSGTLMLSLCLIVVCVALASGPKAGVAVAVLFAFFVPYVLMPGSHILARGRDLYGTWSVTQEKNGTIDFYDSGTLHGSQSPDEPGRLASYYSTSSGFASTLSLMRNTDPAWARNGHVTVVGMGVGVVAAAASAGQRWTFIELNPNVVTAANQFFTFLSDAKGRGILIDTRVGDGRLEAARMPAGSENLVVLDAYQGHTVPTHLLTSEAFAVYKGLLLPGGAIVANATNRNLNIVPVLAASAEANGMTALVKTDESPTTPGAVPSKWVLASSDAAVLEQARASGWKDIEERVTWTDERTPTLPVLALR